MIALLRDNCRTLEADRLGARTPGTVKMAPDLPGEKRTSIIVRNQDDLREFIPAWEELAAAALESSIF